MLEDACQALLSREIGQLVDCVLHSPRKFIGMPDGGILSFNSRVDSGALLWSPQEVWWLKAFSATVIRRGFDLRGRNGHWFEPFQEVEAESPIGSYDMSELSRMLLVNGFGYPAIVERGVEN